MTEQNVIYIGAKRDNLFSEYYLEESKAHKARYNTPMLKDIIERWTEEGQTVMDCMMGVGSILLAATMGRRVIGIEVEPKWYEIAVKNREYIMQRYECKYEPILLKGDASALLPISGVDHIVFSPVYGKAAIHDTNVTASEYTSSDISGYGHTPGQMADYAYPQQRLLMRYIYSGCYDSLKQGGRMITVTRNFYEGRKLYNIQRDIVVDCLQMGFLLEGRAKREANPTGLQNLQRKTRAGRGEVYEPITSEDISIFKKEEQTFHGNDYDYETE